jgi:hypothetical protein
MDKSSPFERQIQMAKGQLRSNREKKKPKQPAKPVAPRVPGLPPQPWKRDVNG